jgi:hypothetical protein
MVRSALRVAVLVLAPACRSAGAPDNAAPAAGDQKAAPAPVPARLTDAAGDSRALLAAGEACARENAAAGLEFDVTVHAIEGDHALLLATPAGPDADSALVFMKRDGGTWRGVAIGSGLECADLIEEGAPERLCSKL